MSTLVLDDDQLAAVDKVKAWLRSGADRPFKLFGYAGTGKSTIVTRIVDDLGLDGAVAYAAFSGKAADVMRRKGCTDASTIHSLIYKPAGQAATERRELRRFIKAHPERAAEFAGLLANLTAEVDNPGFHLRDDDPLAGVRLVVIDEVSMVDREVACDLLSFGVPVLVLGDPGQLPPPHGAGYFIDGAPDVQLTRVHRAAETHPITRMATAIRQSPDGDRRYGAHGSYDEWNGRFNGISPEGARDYDQVLVGTHRARWTAITRLRGPAAPALPTPGERVMVLVNNRALGLLNGQQVTVVQVGAVDTFEDSVELTVRDDDDVERDLPVDTRGFVNHDGEKEARRDTLGGSGLVAMTWGCAVTVHKAQGSQWPAVLVVDEAGTFAWIERKKLAEQMPAAAAEAAGHALARRWLYTAVTRASDRITVVDAIGAAARTIGQAA